jgi:enoyl-CoA hydratase/carnithine racemase
VADITIASDQATFHAPELLRGIADGWLGARLPQRIGIAKTKHMIFTAATINAIKAESIGLISEVVPYEQLIIEAYSIAEKIKHTGPQARGMQKKQINAQLPAFDLEIFQRSTQSEEAKESIDAFINKREPIWQC